MQLRFLERFEFSLFIYVIVFITLSNVSKMEMPCNKSRKLLNSTWGIVTHGPTGSNYTQDSHCEWLIKASNNKFITLTFYSMGTECSYDYLFVYDGDTLNSPLLGSFSGKNEPQQVTSISGSMLILLYSDANYALGGFKAEYSVTDCQRNCTSHGICVGNKCNCDHNWKGPDCSFPICPNDCGSNLGRGACIELECVCSNGFSGQACDLNKNDSFGNSWHWLSSYVNGPPMRTAHTGVYVKETDSFYVFGGYDLNRILGDFYIYDFNSSSWHNQYKNSASTLKIQKNYELGMDIKELSKSSSELNWKTKTRDYIDNLIFLSPSAEEQHFVNGNNNFESAYKKNTDKNENHSENQRLNSSKEFTDTIDKKETEDEYPSPRYGHAASRYPGGFVIYGGKTSKGNLSDELWFYNITSQKWSLRARASILSPPKLTRHTITLVRDELLFLFGGSTVDGEFSSKIYSIKLNSDIKQEQWEYVRPRGGKEFDVRVVAHVTVYFSKIDSLIIYGGITAGLARLSKLSDKMFLFKISSRYWSEIHYPRTPLSDSFVPRERAFHSGVIMGNYFVVFGGYSHRHNKEEICYDNQMYIYHLGCHKWISQDVLGSSSKHISENIRSEPRGVFAHAADVRNGNTLLIFGGYHGNVNADFKAYVLPPTLASREGEPFDPELICGRYRSLHECTSNPECGWCSADEICYGRTVGVNCTTNLQTTRCPGVCPSLGDCHSCLIYGETSVSSKENPFSVAHKLKLEQCVWCVQNARCHHKNDNYGVCGLRDDTPLQMTSWWGSRGTEITSVEECRIKDLRPGLMFIKYKHPINRTHPDSVSIINVTTIDFEVPARDSRQDTSSSEISMVTRFLGFLRIPNEWANVTETLKMCTSFSNAVLRLSHNNMPSNLEIVGNMSAETTACKTAHWASGSSVILHPGRYLVDFESKKSLNSGTSAFLPSKMVLMHNKSFESGKIFTFEYLEPYQNGSCSENSNCLQCLTDYRCGWCDLNQKCLPRDTDETELCRLENEYWSYLTLQPGSCINCSNHITCESCVSSSLCEWWIDEAKCSRRGSRTFSVHALSECPVPCHLRSNCELCLNEKGRCVWCEATKECFSFSVYTSEYQFGLCREWIDQVYLGQNNLQTSYGLTGNLTVKSGQCKSCSKHLNCSKCLETLSCGWCYEVENPTNGICVSGDFNFPEHGECSEILGKAFYKSLSQNESSWSYINCPDVDECDLELDDCHPDAICKNTYGSFTCSCKRGFQGDGRRSCTKTCYNKCIHGTCSMAPDYRCDCHLGWTGEDCGIDCGCNNHSTCTKKVGVCDECQDWTNGEFCQFCKPGSYGNATSERACKECECNGHGDAERGFCDSDTGVCFCKDNTEGNRCEKCKDGFYGNPRNGKICYHQCEPRGIITDDGSKGLGSFRSSLTPWKAKLENVSPKECLWVLKPQYTNSSHVSAIELTIDGEINVKCQDNSVFVYEGFPDLLSFNSQNHALGTFCRREDKTTLTVESKSGTLTVLYRQGNKTEGFNATYKFFSCPDHCPGNRICVQNECICNKGWTGPNCSFPICHNNCSYQFKQGVCNQDYGRCDCKPGFGSSDCSVKINEHQIIFTELFNSIKISGAFDHLRKMIPRFGHSLIIDRRGSLWMFAGYSLSHGPLNDIRLFDTKNNTWMQVTVDSTRDVSMPQGRYFHAAEIVNSRREIYVFGGIGSFIGKRENVLRDFWKFSLKHQRWMDVQTLISPPPVAGHTLTLMKDLESENLFLIGGISPRNGFMNRIWNFNLETEQWNPLTTTGKGPLGIFGHTTVYHGPSSSFYVYGGYLQTESKKIFSRRMFAFHHPSMTWSPLPTFEEYNPLGSNLPQPRFLHSAITTKDYMLVFGGKIVRNNGLSPSLDLLIAYSFSCNQWIRLLHKRAPVVGPIPSFTFGQAMTHDEETGAVYVVGGFDNVIHSEVTRIDLPLDLCNLWKAKENCRSFLGCSFCSVTRPDKTLTSYCYSSLKSLKESCDYHNGTLITNNGVVCDNKWFRQRNCEHFRTCEDCLAKWPTYSDEAPVCKWCGNCSRERCVPANYTCRVDGKCESIADIRQCSRFPCSKPDCPQRISNSSCVEDKPGTVCSSVCSNYNNCDSCLSHKCKWSTALKECIWPDFQPLFCAGGICGLVLDENSIDQCSQPCSSYKQCSTCLRNSRCGWCSSGNSGEGVCMEGSLDKPVGNEPNTCSTFISPLNYTMSWNYAFCPQENECSNGHHTCDRVSEVCEDLIDGFKCVCGPGYKRQEFSCEPVCSQGCVHGKCVQPEICLCDFGYVGSNCSLQCQCNGHSKCTGPDKLNECLECHNNTMGAQCERCKPLFVGDPTHNGTCLPCLEYCNRHTSVCISDSSKQLLVNKSMSEMISMLEEGPKTNALCIGCSNNTTGRTCDECNEGYFRGSEDLTRHCRPCECHGHGNKCDPVTGEKCNCGNNTESECHATVSKNSNQQCWALQCSKCKESYSGTPTDGHQCYKQMTLDQKFCINSKLIEECKIKPKPLQPGQAAFFQVQPRYVNVDIRVFIDVIQGSLDMFMSLKDDSLIVTTNATSGQHLLKWDPKYKKRSTWSDGGFKAHLVDLKAPSVKRNYWKGNESFLESATDGFLGIEKDGEGLTTYITINKKNSFLQIKNIRGRLILTLPKDKFDLITTRFYLGLVASTSGAGVAPTYGILFFRQDQLHIDLFVFFSVFFSCFFLFLAACVIAWKAKQAADLRRARRRHVVEMLHMAKRPFAKIVVHLDSEGPQSLSENRGSQLLSRKRNKSCGPWETRPVAVEPTSDGVAAIATFLVRLPGGSEAPVQLCLASSLIMMSRACHLNNKVFLRRRSSHHGVS